MDYNLCVMRNLNKKGAWELWAFVETMHSIRNTSFNRKQIAGFVSNAVGRQMSCTTVAIDYLENKKSKASKFWISGPITEQEAQTIKGEYDDA